MKLVFAHYKSGACKVILCDYFVLIHLFYIFLIFYAGLLDWVICVTSFDDGNKYFVKPVRFERDIEAWGRVKVFEIVSFIVPV
ncbi:hypothetical protein HPP92_013018 [Vanilla planifolia]|uniref:Uncharacterized protein n=1 Tax=Vanilla planifolia TaxID=51239 RepID=A0A835QWS7_VANPL|nr:hypothetical protein HPP92_013018 [Vanilla planifolia]